MTLDIVKDHTNKEISFYEKNKISTFRFHVGNTTVIVKYMPTLGHHELCMRIRPHAYS